jgi:UDP-N-acetylglucosamine 2-epimerase (non-hydrolysing)
MFSVLSVVGTRPEAIKMAPIIQSLKADPRFSSRVCVTAQHREMLDQILSIFNIVPDIDLNLMRPNQSLSVLSAAVIKALDRVLTMERPDFIFIQGDTTTVLCTALAAFYHHIPVGHVEAGLRTWNFQSPWPEEANRVLVSRLADLHFAPTEKNRENLLGEGIPSDRIFVTGNTVIDALYFSLEKVRANQPEIPGFPKKKPVAQGDGRIVLITGHRRENFGDGFENICKAIAELAKRFPDVCFVYPVHFNPNVRKTINKNLRKIKAPNIRLIDPLPYLSFISLMSLATLILTDSGGIQEEAPSLGKPVLVMRECTERHEAVESGAVKLVGTKWEKIVNVATLLLTNRAAYEEMKRPHNPYGDGNASGRIVETCHSFLAGKK